MKLHSRGGIKVGYSYHMMTSASIFMSLKNECYKYISKEGIHYCSDKADRNKQAVLYCYYILEKFTGEAEQRGIVLQLVKSNRNSLGLNLKIVWNTLLCLKTRNNFHPND
ncbi:hypothetical protein Tsp_03080 [Trichinella spiralis]|uniref:hypothetical protein n=1 Tax=Trichinella spiralis TaxID=6334 RepID=UPI0001EFB7FB|nr:hypothetical protein Tsp_03080 [Trichinella spiralis]